MLTLTKQEIPTPQALDIMLDGEKIGRIEPSQFSKWHAIINLKIAGACQNYVLIQGHADDEAAAIERAIESSLAYHEKAIAAIRLFAARK